MLSIAIINYKNAPLLRLCLKTLQRVLPASFPHEIIVIDIAAGTQTRYAAEEFPNVRYIPFTRNIGYTRGANEGIRAAAGDAVFIMNSDVLPLEGSIEALYRYLQGNPDIGLLGPQLLNFDGSNQESCFRYYSPFTILCRRTFVGALPFARRAIDQFLMRDKDLTRPTESDWLSGSALMASKKAIGKAGFMDERLFLYFSDVDWPHQFWENGYRVVFYPAARMYHYHRRDSRGTVFQVLSNPFTRLHIADGFRYFLKRGFFNASTYTP